MAIGRRDAESIADELGDFSDGDVGSSVGVDNDWEEDSTGDDQLGCRLPTALLSSKPPEDSIHDIENPVSFGIRIKGNVNKGQDGAAPGQMVGIAAMIIMSVMYPARVARLDLLRSVCFLAKRITRWGRSRDRRLHRLIGYVTSHKISQHTYLQTQIWQTVPTPWNQEAGFISMCKDLPHGSRSQLDSIRRPVRLLAAPLLKSRL